MKIKEIHMKIIAIGLIPVFLILAFALPDNAGKALLLAVIVITAWYLSQVCQCRRGKQRNLRTCWQFRLRTPGFFPVSLNKIPDNGLRVSF